LRPGDNEITVTAFNRKDDGASDSKSIVLTLKDERPVLGQTRPEVFPQIGHLGQVFSIAFSPDGRLAISGSDDKKIKIWDVVTGRLIWTLLGHSRQVVSVVFSPDGRLALSGSDDKTARLWNVATGQVMHILQGHSAMVSSVAFSPDCRLALTGSWDDTLKIWEVVTGREIRTLRGHSNSVASVAFSPDGRLVLSGSRDKTIKVWDVASGQIIKTLEGHSDMVMSVAFSPDGRIAISGSYDKTVKLWDVDKGQEVRTLRGHSQVLRRVAFSQNGRLALSGDADQTLKVWDVNTGRELKTLGGGHTGGIVAVAFSPDGRLVLSSGWDWAIKLLDTGTGQEIRTLGGGYANWILSVAVSPDGRVALSGSGDKTIKVWDLASGRQVKTLEGHSGWVKSVAFSPDGRLAVSGSSDRTVKIWDLDSGQELRTIRGDADNLGFNSVAFSSDGKFVLSAGWITHSVSPLKSDQIVKVWDVASGQEIRTLNGHRRMGERAFSPDGRLALFDSDDKKSVKVLDLSSGKVVQLLRGYIPSRGAFSSDGRLILFGQSDGTINLWDVESNREMWKLRAHEQRTLLGYENQITELAFSSDNRLAITGSGLGEVKVWDVTYGHEILALGGHGDWVSSVSFSPDGRLAISGSGDGTVRVWDVASGQELNQMVGFNEGEWVTITPEGYYAASLRGHEFLNVRWKNSVYGINQFYDVFYRPDIVEQKLKGKDISDLITVTIEDAIKKPPPEVEFIGAPKTTTKSSETISYKVKSAGGGIGEIRVFHNGKLIQSDGHYRNRAGAQQKNNRIEDLNSSAIYAQLRGIALIERTVPSPIVSRSKGNIYEGAVEIEPVAGENIVSIAAFNADNTVQSYMKSVTFQAEVKLLTPHLYILAIGTDRYKYHRINLKYAAKDASEITSMLVKEAGVAFDPGNVHHQVLVDEQATKPKILSKIEELAKKTRPTDTFILFVAGHGILTGDQYFMVTHDYDGNLGDDCLISSNEIVEASKKLKALNQLIIFDTCHAGGVDHVINGLYDARMSVLARKMGLHVYAAASSVQEAIDGYRGNGLFSHTLLKGLNNNRTADQNTDSQVSVVELGQYSKTQTAEISTRIGHRQIPLIISFGRDLSLYRLR
jgi:WD40 repeat protein